MLERTFAIIKPDAIAAKNIGFIILLLALGVGIIVVVAPQGRPEFLSIAYGNVEQVLLIAGIALVVYAFTQLAGIFRR